MKTLVFTTVLRVGIVATIIAVGMMHAFASDKQLADPTPPINSADTPIIILHGLPDPVREVRLEEYLYQTANILSDAYADRNENPGGRELRLRTFVRDIEKAVEGRADRYGNILGYSDWKWAVTMEWLAHRETRIARDPKVLGNQDQGRAHGYWQVWEWHGRDPYAALTALDMLIAEPGHSWSVPKGHPWVGYPEAARWIEDHPFGSEETTGKE